MKNYKYTLLLLFTLCVFTLDAQAHKRWVLPSLFTVSDKQWIAVDVTVSNNLFHPDKPWPLKNIQVISPDNSKGVVENESTSHRRSTFDVNLNKSGTFKIGIGGNVYFASYPKDKVKDGEDPNVYLRDFDLESLKAKIPEGKITEYSESISRLETYVTVGAPTKAVFRPQNTGIEINPVTHPNDLYSGEEAIFGFTIDGERVEGIKVLIVQEGTRYRDDEQELVLKTNINGEISFKLNQAGKFLIEVGHEIDLPKGQQFTKRYMSYFGTFEVLPQ